ncbi:hypothetical protein ARAM_001005, partial [Aspergillus rambellii]
LTHLYHTRIASSYTSSLTIFSFVFVHGLNPFSRNDHPFKTWTHQNGTFWPRDYLPQDVPHARVFVYGYNSSVADPQAMSTASIKDHANTLLNLLDMERSPLLNARAPKIIFIGHSLGGLVIKQALLNAHEDRKYTAIRTDTCGLVFFGTPHRGAKGVELGKIAAKIAKFVAKGHASNDLLECLEHNSLFTRQMSSQFSHQLEDYHVISFVEGKEVFIAGAGPASVSHLVVDEESAILGLPGQRETRLKLDADHSQMCKVASRGAMYKLIKGNIKQITDRVLISEQGFIPQPSTSPHPAPPLPPRMHLNSSLPYPESRTPEPAEDKIIGSLYSALDNDPRSIQVAEYKNSWKWDDARRLEYSIFQERHRILGQDHQSTLLSGYSLAEIEFEAAHLIKAVEWGRWVCNNTQRVLGKRHQLAMKAESLMGEILCQQGSAQEGESVCANVLARQQMTIGEDHIDTLETRRRLAVSYGCLDRRQEAIQALVKCSESIERLLGKRHIRNILTMLEIAEQVVSHRSGNPQEIMARQYSMEPDHQAEGILEMYQDLNNMLGPEHPLTIRSMWLHGAMQMLSGNDNSSASETLRRALALAEESLGPEHVETMSIVAILGLMYAFNGQMSIYNLSYLTTNKSSNIELAMPWLQRYLRWGESRMGAASPDVISTLKMIANLYFGARDYLQAQPYYERIVEAYRLSNTQAPEPIQTNLQLCRMNTRYLSPRAVSTDISGLLSAFRRL